MAIISRLKLRFTGKPNPIKSLFGSGGKSKLPPIAVSAHSEWRPDTIAPRANHDEHVERARSEYEQYAKLGREKQTQAQTAFDQAAVTRANARKMISPANQAVRLKMLASADRLDLLGHRLNSEIEGMLQVDRTNYDALQSRIAERASGALPAPRVTTPQETNDAQHRYVNIAQRYDSTPYKPGTKLHVLQQNRNEALRVWKDYSKVGRAKMHEAQAAFDRAAALRARADVIEDRESLAFRRIAAEHEMAYAHGTKLNHEIEGMLGGDRLHQAAFVRADSELREAAIAPSTTAAVRIPGVHLRKKQTSIVSDDATKAKYEAAVGQYVAAITRQANTV